MAKSGFLQEFKAFAMKGNVMDMAVGVIIGGAFGKIVTSLVNNVLMPPIGWLIGGVDFSDLKIELPAAVEGQEPATIAYGAFIQSTIDFLIIAFCVFLLVKLVTKLSSMQKKEEKEEKTKETPVPEPTNEEKLLTEIRDLLKNR